MNRGEPERAGGRHGVAVSTCCPGAAGNARQRSDAREACCGSDRLTGWFLQSSNKGGGGTRDVRGQVRLSVADESTKDELAASRSVPRLVYS